MSAQVMYDFAQGEKKLLTLINATVSHEMRNPLNSINSQIIKMKKLNLKIKELIEDGQIITVDHLKEKIKLITTE